MTTPFSRTSVCDATPASGPSLRGGGCHLIQLGPDSASASRSDPSAAVGGGDRRVSTGQDGDPRGGTQRVHPSGAAQAQGSEIHTVGESLLR